MNNSSELGKIEPIVIFFENQYFCQQNENIVFSSIEFYLNTKTL